MAVYPVPDINSELWNIGTVLVGLCHFMLRDTITLYMATWLFRISTFFFMVFVVAKKLIRLNSDYFLVPNVNMSMDPIHRNSWRRHTVSWDWVTQNTIYHRHTCHKTQSELKGSQNLAHQPAVLDLTWSVSA